MRQFETPLASFVLEAGPHYVALDFLMCIIGVPQAQAQALEAGKGVTVFTAHIPTLLSHIDERRVVLVVMVMIRVVVVLVMPGAVPAAMPCRAMGMTIGMHVPEQAVLPILLAVGQAHVPTLPDPAQAQSSRIRIVERAVLA